MPEREPLACKERGAACLACTGLHWGEATHCAFATLTSTAGYAASIGVTRLEAHVAPGNHASRRVAEAVGFIHAGTFTDDDGTEFIRYTRDAFGDG